MTECGGSQDQGEGPALLPEPVRLRALALAADALGQIPPEQLPAPLRRVASFAPARRARLAATPIAFALETDEAFRDRVATQVRVGVPGLAAALDEGAPPPAAHPVEVAAVAYLLRSDAWKDLAESARDANQPAAEPADSTSGTVERLQRKLRDARGQLRAAQAKARDQLAQAKRENAELRRKLGDARQRASAAEQAAQDAMLGQESAQKDSAALEAEARRLRARVSELEASSSAARRSLRDERESATMRARLLLDAVLDSAQGLRRELALPPVSGKPSDAVAEAVEGVAAREGGTARGAGSAFAAGMALAPDDPALLDELFALPQVHVVIDGYNVTKTAWSSAPLDSQRSRLLTGLAPLVARNRAEVTVVFDGAELKERPPVAGPRGVRVMFSPLGVIADDVIRDLLEAEPPGRPVVVVSSDREVATAADRSGARPVEATALVRLLTRA